MKHLNISDNEELKTRKNNNNNNFSKTKKIILICSCLTILLICSVSAYLITSSRKANEITIGSVKTSIVEEFDPPTRLEPGINFTKKVSVKNNGTNSCYVRILVSFSNSKMGNLCKLDYNTSNWKFDESDGYWYYNGALNPGKTTENLFNNVEISRDADANEFEDFDITIYHESSNKPFK